MSPSPSLVLTIRHFVSPTTPVPHLFSSTSCWMRASSSWCAVRGTLSGGVRRLLRPPWPARARLPGW